MNYYNPRAALAIGSSVFQSKIKNLIDRASSKYYLNSDIYVKILYSAKYKNYEVRAGVREFFGIKANSNKHLLVIFYILNILLVVSQKILQ